MVQIQITPEEFKVKQIEVATRAYRVIRSFADSSLKPVYHHNKPIITNFCGTCKFVKYKGERRFWVVELEKTIDSTGEYDTISLAGDRPIIWLVLKDRYELYVVGRELVVIKAESLHDFEYYAIAPKDEVPFGDPIPLSDVVIKLLHYYRTAKSILSLVKPPTPSA